ncbi:MAG: ATP-binding protein [Myxococcales bacterium]|nr:MAG: ATP-binding protein [Myxococcales bacterium]
MKDAIKSLWRNGATPPVAETGRAEYSQGTEGEGAVPSPREAFRQALRERLNARMSTVRHKVLVMSGKGGVGKSTVAVNLALGLARRGKRVGLLDVDVHGPTVPIMIGLEGARLGEGENGLLPAEAKGVKVVSIAFILAADNTPVIWRGPLKMSMIQQFLGGVDWGELDYLVIDAPPGTGDEPLSIAQLIHDAKALVVTTPQRVATSDVAKSIVFCQKLKMPLIGVVENMAGLVCPHCGGAVHVFPGGAAERMAREMNVPLLASIPIDPTVAEDADGGRGFVGREESPAAQAMQRVVGAVLELK